MLMNGNLAPVNFLENEKTLLITPFLAMFTIDPIFLDFS